MPTEPPDPSPDTVADSPSTATPTASVEAHAHAPGDLPRLALAALGIVYGDIGTSPLYALKECFHPEHGVPVQAHNVLGMLSLVFWSLTLVIVVKYLSFIMRADNRGEGGILALLALVAPAPGKAQGRRTHRHPLVLMGLFGAALLYGDGMITPAISVLSAIEGLNVATTAFEPLVLPATVAILVVLFLFQRHGTAGIGAVFGPTMLVWFASIALAGVPWILRAPQVLWALNPYYALSFLLHHGLHGFLVLGAVVLCITGGEALYADMGHFGKRPIRAAWYAVVFPGLLLNYFGQGAMLMQAVGDPAATARAVVNPFYALISGWLLYPMVVIATLATVVASQALISGAFSLTREAVQLGYFPRVTIIHTSGKAEGQIFVPEVNWALMVACVALVLAFKKSDNLAAAYGIAVTGTMAITSVLFYAVARQRWHWSAPKALSLVSLFMVVDLSFLCANLAKIAQGGWFPLVVALLIFTVMLTWKAGRAAIERYLLSATLPVEAFLADLERREIVRVPGTAVFMTHNPEGVPGVLLHHFKHNKVLHERVVLLSVMTERVPEVPDKERVKVRDLDKGFYQVTAFYGFMQSPNVPEIMKACRGAGLKTPPGDTSYFLGRETLLTTGKSGLARWRKLLFSFLSRNAVPATAYFGLPPNRVVELGAQIEL